MKKLSHTGDHKMRREQPAATAGRVLIFAYDKRPVLDREELLAHSGYQVAVCDRFSSALNLLRKRDPKYDFLVIGYAVPEQERLRLAQAYRDAYPTGEVIFLYRTAIKNSNPPVAALLSINGAKDNLLTAIRSVEQLRTNVESPVHGGKDTASRTGGRK